MTSFRSCLLVVSCLIGASPLAASGAALVANYTFDGDTLDHTGTANGTKTSAVVYTTDRRGTASAAIEHTSASAARVEFGNQSVFNNLGNDFTIALWTRISPGNGGIIVNHDQEGTYSNDWVLGVEDSTAGANTGKPFFTFGNPAIVGNTRLDDGQWHHLAVRRNAAQGSFAFFVDGVVDFSLVGNTYTRPGDPRVINLHGDLTRATATNTGPYYESGSWQPNGFVGRLDDLRFYTGQLTDSQIATLAAPLPAAVWTGTGLLGLLGLRRMRRA